MDLCCFEEGWHGAELQHLYSVKVTYSFYRMFDMALTEFWVLDEIVTQILTQFVV